MGTGDHTVLVSLCSEIHEFKSRRLRFLGLDSPIHIPLASLQPEFELILRFKEL